MKNNFNNYKWLNLIGFTLLYNSVYIARFSLNDSMELFSAEIDFTATQEGLLGIAVYVSYAVGSLINGRFADGKSPKNIIAMGVIVSVIANLMVALSNNWLEIFTIWLINGYFQSMIWIGGMCLIARFWASKERGMASGIANFASGMSHVSAYVIPIIIGMAFPYLSWRSAFVLPLGLMALFLVIFWLITTDSPDKEGFDSYDEENKIVIERETFLKREIYDKHGNPWKFFFTRPKFIWWCIIAMLSSLCRYGLLKWIPIYYLSSDQGAQIMNPVFINLILPIGMAIGTLIITWLTAKKFLYNKGITVICSAAMCGSLMLIFPLMPSTDGILTGIFCTGFFLYGINGVLWIYALDRGGRIFPGTVVGILNCFAYIGAALESFIFPIVIHYYEETISIFLVMEIICIALVVFGMLVSERDTELEEEEDFLKNYSK